MIDCRLALRAAHLARRILNFRRFSPSSYSILFKASKDADSVESRSLDFKAGVAGSIRCSLKVFSRIVPQPSCIVSVAKINTFFVEVHRNICLEKLALIRYFVLGTSGDELHIYFAGPGG